MCVTRSTLGNLQTVAGAWTALPGVLTVRCRGATWKRQKLLFRRNGGTVVCFLIKLWLQWKILSPFNLLYFFHTTHLWHRAPHSPGSWHPLCLAQGPCFSPGAGLTPRLPRCLLPIRGPPAAWEPAAERGLVRGALGKDGGCFWLGEMSRQGFSQHLPINQIEHTDWWPALETLYHHLH